MEKLILVYGLQRSGNHAIINWISSFYSSVVFFNDLEHDFFDSDDNKKNIEKELKNHVVICSFEDSSNKMRPNLSFLESSPSPFSSFFSQFDVIPVFIVRDPYNCWASRKVAHSKRGLTSSNDLKEFVYNWKSIALKYINDEGFILVAYNSWFKDPGYRKKLWRDFGGEFYSEESLKKVPSYGGGSSFDGKDVHASIKKIARNPMRYLNFKNLVRLCKSPVPTLTRVFKGSQVKASDLRVEGRWLAIREEQDFDVLVEDIELRELSEYLTNFSIPGSIE